MMVLKIIVAHALLALVAVPLLCSVGVPVHLEHCEAEDCEDSESDLGHDPCDLNVARRPNTGCAQGGLPLVAPAPVLSQVGDRVASGERLDRVRSVPPGLKLPCPPSELPQLA